MKRRKATNTMELAATRSAGCASIDANLDLGNGLTIKEYGILNENARKSLEVYNTSMATTESKLEEHEANEALLANFNERMLLGVAINTAKTATNTRWRAARRNRNAKSSSNPPSSSNPDQTRFRHKN